MTDDSILCAGRTTDSDLPVDRHRHTRDAAWGDDGEIDAVLFRLGGPQFEIQGGVRFGGDRLEQRPGLSISPDGDTVWLAGATASGDLAIPGTEGSSGGVYAAAFDASTYELLGGVKFRLLEGGSGTVAAASGAEAWLCVHSIRQWLPLVDPVGLGTDDTHPSQVHLSRVALAGLPRRPRAPSDVAAVPLSPRRVRVQWTAGAGSPAGFAIDRDLGNGFERVAALPGTATEFDDGDVPADASVAYTVRALGDHGDSPLSAEARAVTPASLSLRFDSGLQTLRRKRTDATLRLKGSLGAPSGTTAEVDPVRDGLTLTMFAATGPVVLVELGAADGWWAGGPRRKTWRAPGTRVDWRPRERVFTVRVKRATPYLSGPGTFAVRGQTPSGEAGTASLSWRRDRGTALRAP